MLPVLWVDRPAFPGGRAGGEEQPQVAVMGLPEFLPLVLPGNFVHLLEDGLGALVMLRLPQQLLELPSSGQISLSGQRSARQTLC